MSDYSFSNLPEVVPVDTYDGKVVVPHDDKETVINHEKEIVLVENLPIPFDEERGKEAVPFATKSPLFQKSQPVKGRLNRSLCGVRTRWILLGLALLVISIVVLGVGLGVGLQSG